MMEDPKKVPAEEVPEAFMASESNVEGHFLTKDDIFIL